MLINLVIRKQTDSKPYTITCDLAERLVFGRSLASPVNLTGSEISREHFAVFSRYGEVCVQDLSSNGTMVNGRPVMQKKTQKLSEGDVISVPGYEIELESRRRAEPVRQAQRFAASQQLERIVFRHLSQSFTLWEIVVIAAAIASFVLITYYFMR